MHYYQHNIADYRKDTSHLTLMEHGIYRQLLDSYYLDEIPITNDLSKLMRSHCIRTAEEQQSLKNVLADFFELTKKGYVHKRCDEVIAQYHGKSDKARASAMARWANKHKDIDANALPTQSESNPNGMLTINHKPITNNHINTPEGVTESVWNDYLKIRKAAKKPLTDTALKGLVREAGKANKTLNEALVICCERSWLGFKAEWLKGDVQQVEKVKFI
jgi:uncharacterized protein YdaU (DUF1376 family)